jgi:hypothetical protein
MYRLLSTGDHEELRFIEDLRAIECTVHDVDPDTGNQFEISDFGGHFSGHLDGCAIGIPEAPKTWHVTEYKTHNAKSFAKLVKEGVKKAKPQHYAQMQVYMHKTGMTRSIYLAVNKDTDELYSERVRYDAEEAKLLMDRAERVITATVPPERIAQRADWYECSWCDARDVCWGSETSSLPIAAISCRQCCHATPTMDGNARWVCEKHKRGLSETDQVKACEDHLVLPGLLSFAEPIDYGKDENGHDWIVFRNSYGNKDTPDWRHGRCEGAFSTKELSTLSPSALVNPTVVGAKRAFGAVATGFCRDDILHRYPESDARIVWKGRASQLVEVWKETYAEDLASLTPIVKCDATEYRAAEYDRGRVAIFYPITKNAEIREGVE